MVHDYQIGRIVDTVGWVDVEWGARADAPKRLPPGYRFILKHVDKYDRAYIYRDNTGLLMAPRNLFEEYER